MSDIAAIVWKEWKELFAGEGRGRAGWWRMGFVVGVIGVLLPLQTGAQWVTSPLGPMLMAWLPIMLIVAIIADSFAGERERHTLETLLASRLGDRTILFGKILASVLYGLGVAAASTVLSLLVVNLVAAGDGLLLFPARTLFFLIVFAVLTAFLAAGAGVLVSLRAPTVRQAQQTLSIVTMLLVFVPTFTLPALPREVRGRLEQFVAALDLTAIGLGLAGALLVVDIVLLLASAARFRRDRLIVP